MTVIGFSGFARSGKTTAAKYLQDEFNGLRLHIADPLRRMLSSLLNDFGYDQEAIDRYLTGDWKEHVIPVLGITSRQAQITLGTEWGRAYVSSDLWANLWKLQASQINGSMIVINDSVRFPNEERVIRELGGINIMVVRSNTVAAAYKWKRLGPWLYRYANVMWGVHDSERVDRLKPDYIVTNDGDSDDLFRQIDNILLLHYSLYV